MQMLIEHNSLWEIYFSPKFLYWSWEYDWMNRFMGVMSCPVHHLFWTRSVGSISSGNNDAKKKAGKDLLWWNDSKTKEGRKLSLWNTDVHFSHTQSQLIFSPILWDTGNMVFFIIAGESYLKLREMRLCKQAIDLMTEIGLKLRSSTVKPMFFVF